MANEKRLIDANKLKNEIAEENPYIHVGPFGYCACSPKTDGVLVFKREEVLRAIDSAPTVDAEEVVHGYNLDEDTPSLFECSICHWSCGDTYYGDTADYNYCPNCGAKMDGDGNG